MYAKFLISLLVVLPLKLVAAEMNCQPFTSIPPVVSDKALETMYAVDLFKGSLAGRIPPISAQAGIKVSAVQHDVLSKYPNADILALRQQELYYVCQLLNGDKGIKTADKVAILQSVVEGVKKVPAPAHKPGAEAIPQSAPVAPQIQVGGPIVQTGGDCTQNVVGGSGNTNICGFQPLRISSEQGAAITQYVKASGLSGSVTIDYEFGADQRAIAALNSALQNAGLQVTVMDGSMMVGGCDTATHNNIPGLSINCADVNDPLTNTIAQAFVSSKIFPDKAPASPNVFQQHDGKVHLLVRKP
jgi:uncharacterized protein YunC (DUF1805 family)